MKKLFLLASLISISLLGFSQVTESFDGLSENSYGNYDYNGFHIENGLCNSEKARTGNAVRLRNAASYLEYQGADGNGYDGGVGTISFWYRSWDSSPNAEYDVKVKIGAGAWQNVGAAINTNSETYAQWTFDLNDPADDILIRVERVNGERLHIDDFSITTFGGGPVVDAPIFTPAAGTYFEAQDVSMATSKAVEEIYYTTDGTDPDNTSTLYTVPVNIAATTTLKAVTFDGADYSSITTGVYTITPVVQVADMATLRTQPDDNSTIYELTGEAFLTYQQSYRNKKYIQDATAGIEIDDPTGVITTLYNINDGITGIKGKLNTYNGILQFVPIADPGAATSTGNTVTPLLITADDFNNNHEMYECRLVRIDNLTFDDAGGTFSTGTQYPTVDHLGAGVLFRTNFYDASYIGNTIPTGAQDIVGIVYEFNGTPQFTARETTDIMPHVPVIPMGSTGIIIAGLLMAAVLVVRRGRLF